MVKLESIKQRKKLQVGKCMAGSYLLPIMLTPCIQSNYSKIICDNDLFHRRFLYYSIMYHGQFISFVIKISFIYFLQLLYIS